MKNIIVRVTPPSILLHAFNFEKDINSLYNSDTIKYYLIRNINLVLILLLHGFYMHILHENNLFFTSFTSSYVPRRLIWRSSKSYLPQFLPIGVTVTDEPPQLLRACASINLYTFLYAVASRESTRRDTFG